MNLSTTMFLGSAYRGPLLASSGSRNDARRASCEKAGSSVQLKRQRVQTLLTVLLAEYLQGARTIPLVTCRTLNYCPVHYHVLDVVVSTGTLRGGRRGEHTSGG